MPLPVGPRLLKRYLELIAFPPLPRAFQRWSWRRDIPQSTPLHVSGARHPEGKPWCIVPAAGAPTACCRWTRDE